MPRRFSSALLLSVAFVVLACSSFHSVAAQTSTALPNGPALGGTLDRFIYEGQGITAVTFRFSDLRSGSAGSEIGISLFPDAAQTGSLYLASDLGPAFNASGPGVTVLLKAGLSTLLGLGGGFGFTPGYHLGAGLIVRGADRLGIRVDVARHVYIGGVETTEPIWSVGLGFTSLPLRRATPERGAD